MEFAGMSLTREHMTLLRAVAQWLSGKTGRSFQMSYATIKTCVDDWQRANKVTFAKLATMSPEERQAAFEEIARMVVSRIGGVTPVQARRLIDGARSIYMRWRETIGAAGNFEGKMESMPWSETDMDLTGEELLALLKNI